MQLSQFWLRILWVVIIIGIFSSIAVFSCEHHIPEEDCSSAYLELVRIVQIVSVFTASFTAVFFSLVQCNFPS